MDSAEAIERVGSGLDALLGGDHESLEPVALLRLVGEVEVAARRLAAVQVALAGALDRTGAHTVDGHRTAKAALRHVGRVSGPEAHRRVRTARALRSLPDLTAAVEDGRVPVEMAHAIGRAASNPRVSAFLDAADPVFAEQASIEAHDRFVSWLGEWERLADADGAAQDSEAAHRRRTVTLVQSDVDGSWLLRGQFGALQGSVLADALAGFEAAEATADHEEARRRLGEDATASQRARTASQRRADALVALARAALSAPHGGHGPEPLVNIVIDDAGFTEAMEHAAGGCGGRRLGSIDRPRGACAGLEPDRDDSDAVDGDRDEDDPDKLDPAGHVCATTSGHSLHPGDALAAALVGHVRRVVVDAEGRVIDLGRRRRLFTGGSREGARLQAAIAARGPTRCLWSSCTASPSWLQVDHCEPWHRDGPTDTANSALLCGHHNRLKETGYRPVRALDGGWVLVRPDGSTITPAV